MSSSRSQTLPVAVDAMGGDQAPESVVAGACLAARDGVAVLLIGDRSRIDPLIASQQLPADAPLTVSHTDQAVSMGGSPLAALRENPDASVRLVLEAVRAGRASAAVSFGNSGAAVIEAVRTLRLLPGVARPALAVALPTLTGGQVVMLDVGANVDVRPEQLAGFAHLGAAWSRSRGVSAPRVGVLSNGREPSKGNQLTRACMQLLEQAGMAARPIEPADVLAGQCDVVVCDGFVGNVLIKGMEAAMDLVAARAPGIRDHLSRPTGAVLLGVSGVVVIGHGASDASVVHKTIARAALVGGAAWIATLAENLDNGET